MRQKKYNSWNFPNLLKYSIFQKEDIKHQAEHKEPVMRLIIVKMVKIKDKEQLLKAVRKNVIYRGQMIQLMADFSSETMKSEKISL